MSLLNEIAIKKLPFEKYEWKSLVVRSITPDLVIPDLYIITFYKNTVLSMQGFPFDDGDVCYIYNHSETSQPIKLIMSDIDAPNFRCKGLTDGADITTWGDKCIVSGHFGSDVISANMDSQLIISCIDAVSTYYDYDQSTSIMELGFSETFADGIYRLRFWDSATDKIVYMNAQLTLDNSSALGVNYYFVYDTDGDLYLFNVATTVCLIQHIDTKYTVDVFSNRKKIGTFSYTPTRDFELSVNLRSYLESLFFSYDGFFNSIYVTNSFLNSIYATEYFLRSIKLSISYGNVNLNFSDYIYFTTTLFVNDSGYCTMEKYTTGANFITPFNNIIPYKSGMGFILIAIFFSDTVDYHFKCDDGVSTNNFTGKKGYNAYMLSKLILPSEFPTKCELYKNIGTELLKTIPLKNIGVYSNEITLLWVSLNGVTGYVFNCEYDEDLTNEQIYTYNKTNVSNVSTRKLSLTAKNLTEIDKKGLSTLIESILCVFAVIASNTYIPIKIETGSAKIRQSNEVSYSMDLVVEIDRNIKI